VASEALSVLSARELDALRREARRAGEEARAQLRRAEAMRIQDQALRERMRRIRWQTETFS